MTVNSAPADPTSYDTTPILRAVQERAAIAGASPSGHFGSLKTR
jgi:hypothetical protein